MPREAKATAHKLTAYNKDNKMLLRRKKARALRQRRRHRPRLNNQTWARACGAQIIDPFELVLVKMPPPPLPTSWGKVIQTFEPEGSSSRGGAPAGQLRFAPTSCLALYVRR